MKTALIAGATGLIGKQLLEKLLASSRYSSVIVLSRSPITLRHPKLTNIITDFNQLDKALTGVTPHDVFCCLGTTMAKAGSKKKFYEVDFGGRNSAPVRMLRNCCTKYSASSSL